jgi:phosphopantothenoylcysteine decarboxylase/phosphopantothenate--cysteine ligase
MHTEMWEQPATQRNVAQLIEDGALMVGPTEGALTSGDTGAGRMVEPEEIVDAIVQTLGAGDMNGLSVLVTAGGTREAIDPVRYIGNRSSGKMGNAIALDAAKRGADVLLVTTAEPAIHPNVTTLSVETAEQMAEAAWANLDGLDVAIMAAAVADFRPDSSSGSKMARSDGPPTLSMEATPDVLAGVVERSPDTFVVGFAAEVGSLDRAVDKAARKKVNLLVANDVARDDSGFGTETNRVSIVDPGGDVEEWPTLPKAEVASRLWDLVIEHL